MKNSTNLVGPSSTTLVHAVCVYDHSSGNDVLVSVHILASESTAYEAFKALCEEREEGTYILLRECPEGGNILGGTVVQASYA